MRIVWIASYPKSGNTWARAFLANCAANQADPLDVNAISGFGFSDGNVWPYERLAGRPFATLTDEAVHGLRPKAQQLLASARPGLVPVKTHAAVGHAFGVPTINTQVTHAALYVLRNPLDVAVSYSDHYGLSLDAAVKALINPHTGLARTGTEAPLLIGDWATHVRSWTGVPSDRLVVLRYEDMLADPTAAFAKLPPLLGLARSPDEIARAVRHARFEELARQETQGGFRERSRHQKRFFREGRVGQWRAELSNAQVDRIVKAFAPEMRRFGYLDADDRPSDP